MVEHKRSLAGRGGWMKVTTALCVLMLGFAANAVFAQGRGRAKVRKGNELFEQGKYDEASNAYRDAKVDNPTSPIIDYNIANALYEKRKYEDALKLYDRVTKNTDDPLLQAESYYNLGNTLYRLNKLPESILAYQEALKLNPNDKDAKYNLEYVRAKLKQNAKKQPQQQHQQQEQQKQGENKQTGDQQKQDDKEQQQQQQKETKQIDEQNQKEKEDQKKEQMTKPKEISKEDAERILNALQNEEKDLQKGRKMKAKGRRRTSKDW